jgi:hypothetical protein
MGKRLVDGGGGEPGGGGERSGGGDRVALEGAVDRERRGRGGSGAGTKAFTVSPPVAVFT